MWQFIVPGFLLGLISSFHCIGMCGPLALALPVHHLSRPRQAAAMALYNAGRVITYALLGGFFGIAGRGIYLAGLQQWLSIMLGLIMFGFSVQYFVSKRTGRLKWLNNFYTGVQNKIGFFLRSQRMSGYLVTGILNGFLPCGMVYIAIAGALTTTQVSNSVLFMVLFGLGTLPAMLALGLFGFRIRVSIRQYLKSALPYFIAGISILLILRGMQLGIPFVSPVLAHAHGEAMFCH